MHLKPPSPLGNVTELSRITCPATQHHIPGDFKSSATRLWCPQTLCTSFTSHDIYFSFSNIKNHQKKVHKIILTKFPTSQICQTNLIQLSTCWIGTNGRLQRWKTYVDGVSQYTDCNTLWYTKMWPTKKRQACIHNISKLNFILYRDPNFSFLNQLPIYGL